MNDAAKNVVDELLGDLDDRSGFDTGLVDPRAMDEWRGRWEVMVSRALEAARAEGYEKAREQAAVVGHNAVLLSSGFDPLFAVAGNVNTAILAMQDERADVASCPQCGHDAHFDVCGASRSDGVAACGCPYTPTQEPG